jgi:hypothetical protein
MEFLAPRQGALAASEECSRTALSAVPLQNEMLFRPRRSAAKVHGLVFFPGGESRMMVQGLALTISAAASLHKSFRKWQGFRRSNHDVVTTRQ